MSAGVPWWATSVVYQIYPRSFCDSNGDGIGDLRGITSRLDHLAALGVGIVWLSPVYASPNDDNGYDISDHRAIHPEFGTMADFDEMLAAMHARGIRLVMDLVVNHTSDDHAWFRRARRSRDDPRRDFYIWADPVDGREPNNWESVFGGPAWQFDAVSGQYYLHLFARRQPDLNWENPCVREEVHALMRFWLDKGVDGFRMDVINLISKTWTEGRLPDAPAVRPGFLQPAIECVANGPRLMEFLREMRRAVLDGRRTVTVGEAPGVTPALAQALTDREIGALDMLFQFDHVGLDQQPGGGKWDLKPLDLRDLKRALSAWQAHLAERGWNSLYLNNHDQPRALSRWGDDGRWRRESAKALALLIHGMKGTPYVYQGEELGMTNFPFTDLAQCRDVETLNWAAEAAAAGRSAASVIASVRAKGRDNARTPMPWSAADGAGFTAGTPWIALNPNHREINAEAERADPDAVFHFYRRLIALRRTLPALVHGRYALLCEAHPQVFAYTRTHEGRRLLVLCNLSSALAPLQLPPDAAVDGATVHLSSRVDSAPHAGTDLLLAPWEALLLELPTPPSPH